MHRRLFLPYPVSFEFSKSGKAKIMIGHSLSRFHNLETGKDASFIKRCCHFLEVFLFNFL